MRALVTGATGFVGYNVARLLRDKGFEVRALARDVKGSPALASLGVEVVRGDVRDRDSLDRAVKGCDRVFHVAADYRLWVPDPATMYEINVQGTKNAMEAALKGDVERVVYTSTVGVLAASGDGSASDENTPVDFSRMAGHYKRSKFLAEKEVRSLIGKGLPAVIVNPSTPIGPMDVKPTPTGRIVVDFLNGKIPAYLDTGLNFVDVEDVAVGHILASEKGKVGERYILGNTNLTLKEFLFLLAKLTGKKPPAFRLPYLPVLVAAHLNEAVSKFTGSPPAIPLAGVRMAGKYMFFDCSKAKTELGLPQTSIESALEKAVSWFREKGYIRKA